MLARDYVKKGKKPIILSSHMIGGLKEGQRKMSKSDPENAIFMADSVEDVKRKIKRAYCVEGEVEDNAVLEIIKFFIFGLRNQFKLTKKFGDDVVYEDYAKLEEDYKAKEVHPDDLKKSTSSQLNDILEPIREHFRNDPKAR